MSVDLSTTYLGMKLKNPLVASASPVTGNLGSLLQLESAGVSAVVLPSLFEEQIEHEADELMKLSEFGAGHFAEALGGYFPELDDYNTGPGEYLQLVEQASAALEIPVIASLNGTTAGGWVRYAEKMEAAGASAIELNVYLMATDPEASAEDVEQRYLELVETVRQAISIPLAVKVGPQFSSFPHMARRLADAGADGLVLFNRFYQPDIDLEELAIEPHVSLSTSAELRLPLRWIAVIHGHVGASLALTTGIHSAGDAIKGLLVGADVVMLASALLRHGPDYIGTVLEGLQQWLVDNEYDSVSQLVGSMSQRAASNPEAFVRANYMQMLVSYSRPAP
ncbi:MAG: dihydroorotate dehydrogenase-like protein [Acidimicrobiia bacterium]|nr:dihydroorotate dehydrogenase-like protein [Acidimicrobiia bacterium]